MKKSPGMAHFLKSSYARVKRTRTKIARFGGKRDDHCAPA